MAESVYPVSDNDELIAFARRCARTGSPVDGRSVGLILDRLDALQKQRATVPELGEGEELWLRNGYLSADPEYTAACVDSLLAELDALRERLASQNAEPPVGP